MVQQIGMIHHIKMTGREGGYDRLLVVLRLGEYIGAIGLITEQMNRYKDIWIIWINSYMFIGIQTAQSDSHPRSV
jgi:hypothetical protein